MTLFDTHAHLLDEQFDRDRDRIIRTLPALGVGYAVEACCDGTHIPKIEALVAVYDHIYGSAGVHPHSASMLTRFDLNAIERAVQKPKIVAVGEIGLDYHYDLAPRDVQRDAFVKQVEIATAHDVPVIVHDREAHGDCMEILSAFRGRLKGVMHCYSGSYEDAVRYIDMGLYIAFGGALTFKNATKQRDIAGRLPMERLVIETDCPYMTPVPYRGSRNDPSLMHYTLKTLASVRGMDADEAAEITTENARALFGIG